MNYSRAGRARKDYTKGDVQAPESKIGPSSPTAHSPFTTIEVLPITPNKEDEPDRGEADTTWLTNLGAEFALGFSATHIPGTQNPKKRLRRVLLGPPMPDFMVIVPHGAQSPWQTRIIAATLPKDLKGQSSVSAVEWTGVIEPQTSVPLEVTSEALAKALEYARRIGVEQRWKGMIARRVQEAAKRFYADTLPSYLLQQALEQLQAGSKLGGPHQVQTAELIAELLRVQSSLAREYQEEIRTFINGLREGGVRPDSSTSQSHATRRLRTVALASAMVGATALLGGANRSVHKPSTSRISLVGARVAHVSEMEMPLAQGRTEGTREPRQRAATLGELGVDFSNRPAAIRTEVDLQGIINKITTSPEKFGRHLLQALKQSGFTEAEIEQFSQRLLTVAIGLGLVGTLLTPQTLSNLKRGRRGAILGLLAIAILTTACGGMASPTPTPVPETPAPTPTPRPVNREIIDINSQTGFQLPIETKDGQLTMQHSFYVASVPQGGNWTNTIRSAMQDYYNRARTYNPERTLTYADGKTEITEAREHLENYALGLPWTIILQGHYKGAPVLIELKPGDKPALEFLTRFGIGPWPGDKVLIGHQLDTTPLEILAERTWPNTPMLKISFLTHESFTKNGQLVTLREVEVSLRTPNNPNGIKIKAGAVMGGAGEWYIYDPGTDQWVPDSEAFKGDLWAMMQKYSNSQ